MFSFLMADTSLSSHDRSAFSLWRVWERITLVNFTHVNETTRERGCWTCLTENDWMGTAYEERSEGQLSRKRNMDVKSFARGQPKLCV